MASILEQVEIAHEWRLRVSDAAEEWANARSAVLEIAASNPEYMGRLNRLSEAEDRLSRTVMAKEPEHV